MLRPSRYERELTLGYTKRRSFFMRFVQHYPNRLRIAAEGDSWFDYPSQVGGDRPANILDHIADHSNGTINLFRMASNGDGAAQIMGPHQAERLEDLLDNYQNIGLPLHALLISMGGNDIAGKGTLKPLLRKNPTGVNADDYIDSGALSGRLAEIRTHYQALVDLRDSNSPDTVIIAQTYDFPHVSDSPARYMGFETGPWLYPDLHDSEEDIQNGADLGIPSGLWDEIIKLMLLKFKDMLEQLVTDLGSDANFIVVADTQDTLTSHNQWLNEMHPTSEGFELIAEQVYAALRTEIAGLPDW